MATIAILGSSTYWTPGIVTDLVDVFEEKIEFRLIDIDPKALELCKSWGEAANKHHNRNDDYYVFTDRREALKDVDAALITISTGGLDMMKHDIGIPEKYGIFATVGDTAGPSGWSRSIRNIPVFMEFARDFQELCPNAFIANYTNPMSALTATIQKCCANPSVGLCHSYHQTKDRIQYMFELENWNDISVEIAGMNHFHWITDFSIKGKNGYKLLKEKIKNGSIADLMPKNDLDENGKVSIYFGSGLMETLYETYGFLPYAGDRHTAEFLPYTLSNFPERYKKDNNKGDSYDTIKYCNIYRTEHKDRVKNMASREEHILNMINQKDDMPKRSTETAAEMIKAYINNKPFMDAVNHLNTGQIPGLPLGTCVETMGSIDGLGVHPCIVGDIPEYLLEAMRPQAICQKWIVDGVINKDKNFLMQALYHDPQCASMTPQSIRKMADELIAANREYINF